jgi:predicted Rossmann-fold nucleotide-binding protein
MQDQASLADILSRVSMARQRFEELLAGGKPLLDPSHPQDKAFIEIIKATSSEVPSKFFYKTPTSLKDAYFTERQAKIDTSAHFLSMDLVEESAGVVSFLKDKGHKNIAVAGDGLRTREAAQVDEALKRADNFVLTPQADFISVFQALTLLEHQVQEAMAGITPSSLPRLFILNAKGHFDPLLRFCGLDKALAAGALTEEFSGGKAVPKPPVYQAASLEQLEKLVQIKGLNTRKALAVEAPLFVLDGKGPLPLSHATGNGEKINDLERIVRTLRYPLDLHHIDEAIGPNPENCELRGSFSSNAEAKYEEVSAAIAATSPAIIKANLGKDNARRALYVVSDGGIIFNDPRVADYFLNHPQFGAHLRTLIHPDIGFPGPESKPVMSAVGGKENFFRMVVEAFEKIKAEGGTPPDYGAVDNAVFMIGFYDPAAKKMLKLAVRSTIPMQFLTSLNLEDEYGSDISGRHYTKLVGSMMTLAQQDDRDDPAMSRETAFARAFNGLLATGGIKENTLVPEFAKSSRPNFRVQFDSQVIINGRSFDHSKLIESLWDHNIQSTDWAGEIRTIDDLRAFFAQRYDLMVISGRAVSKTLPAERLMADWLIPCVGFVDSQTDPTACPPIIQKTEYTKPFLKTIRQMIQTGVIGERMCDVIDIAHTPDQLQDKILATAASAKARSIKEDVKPQTATLRDSGRSNISLLVSASSQNPKHLDSSYSLTRNFIDNGWGIVTGMGKKSAMGLSVYAGLEAKANGQDAYVAGVQEPVLVKREGFPVEHVEAFFGKLDAKNQANAIIETSRLERILKILEADKLLEHYERTGKAMKKVHVGVGGAGTLEEILIGLWLKMSGHPAFKDVHVVLLNHDEIFKPFIEHMNGSLPINNLHVAESEAEVIKIVGRILRKPDAAYTHYARPHGVGFHPFEPSENPNLSGLMARASFAFKGGNDNNKKGLIDWLLHPIKSMG